MPVIDGFARRIDAFALVVVVLLAATFLGTAAASADQPVAASSGHPRILLRAQDLPRLRSWARSDNPVWMSLRNLGKATRETLADGDPGTGPGTLASGCANCEDFAFLMAFMSLMPDDPATAIDEPSDYANYGHDVLMSVIDRIASCVDAQQPDGNELCASTFATGDRSRWFGNSLPMAVDELYPSGVLTIADKAKIRRVFRFLAERTIVSSTQDYRPNPIGVLRDPRLVAGHRDRWGANNYFTAHMRNLTMWALALDPQDDPAGPVDEPIVWNQGPYVSINGTYRYRTLREYLDNASGAWMYVANHVAHGDTAGGVPPEGISYGAGTSSFIAQTVASMESAGVSQGQEWGAEGSDRRGMRDGVFDDMLSGFVHAIPNTGYIDRDFGQMWQPALFGDIDNRYELGDWIRVFGVIGLHDRAAANPERLSHIQYVERKYPPGGADRLLSRAGGIPDNFAAHFALESILYFTLFGPDDPPATDPHEGLPPQYFAPGIGRIFARTGWGPQDSLFTFGLGWKSIDHQHADGNDFGFWRAGEWLTRQRTAYANDDTSQHNGLVIQNVASPGSDLERWQNLFVRGSQWTESTGGTAGPGVVEARSVTGSYAFVSGNATDLYNDPSHGANDVAHASRDIMWVKPDHMVVYDRATSRTPGHFKRFWLHLAGTAQVDGRRMSMTTPHGQHLYDTVLLPENAALSVEDNEPDADHGGYFYTVELDPIQRRLRVEATGAPQDTRFLNVLQGADAGVGADDTQRVTSQEGTAYDGTVVHGTAVLFPHDLGQPFSGTAFTVSQGTRRQLLTGLTPGGAYSVAESAGAAGAFVVRVTQGGAQHADAGGVLDVALSGGQPHPDPTPSHSGSSPAGGDDETPGTRPRSSGSRPPTSRIARRAIRASRTGRRWISGTAADDSRVVRVDVSMVAQRRRRGKAVCIATTKNKFKIFRAVRGMCAPRFLLRAQGAASWRLDVRKLPVGRWMITSRATDDGHAIERTFSRARGNQRVLAVHR